MKPQYSQLVAIWLEGLLYGLYVPIFATAVYYLAVRPNSPVNKTILAVTSVLFMLGTMHVAGSFKTMIDAFITFADRPGGPAAFFANEREPINVFRKAVSALSILVGDGLVIYRCYVIWSRNWWIVAGPIASMVATFITGLVVARDLLNLKGNEDTFTRPMLISVPLYFSFSFVTNLLVTFLIGFRLWTVSRAVASLRTGGRSLRTVAILTESAAIYPIVNLFALILFAIKDNAQVIPSNALCQIIGIAPTLIVVQVQAGLSETDRGYSMDSRQRSGVPHRPSTARTEYHVSTFAHGNNSSPMVISIGSTTHSTSHEITDKEGTTV